MTVRQSFYQLGSKFTLLDRTPKHALYRRNHNNGSVSWEVIGIGRAQREVKLGEGRVLITQQEFLHLSEGDYNVNTWVFTNALEARTKFESTK